MSPPIVVQFPSAHPPSFLLRVICFPSSFMTDPSPQEAAAPYVLLYRAGWNFLNRNFFTFLKFFFALDVEGHALNPSQ